MIARSLKAKILVFAVFLYPYRDRVLIANFLRIPRDRNHRPTSPTTASALNGPPRRQSVRDFSWLNPKQREQMDKIHGRNPRRVPENFGRDSAQIPAIPKWNPA